MTKHHHFLLNPGIIGELPFFADLNPQEKADLLNVARVQSYSRRHLLFTQGDAVKHFYCIYKGAIQVFRTTSGGRELTSELLMPGDLLCELESLGQRKIHLTNARIVKDAVLVVVPIEWLKSHLKAYDELALKLVTILSRRLLLSQLETEHQVTMNASQIVACFLQHLCILHGFDPRGFELPYTKSLIASRLGMELETFSRTLCKLKDIGIIVNGKQVVFENITLIQNHTCGNCTLADECDTHQTLKANTHKMVRKLECAD